VACKGRNFTPRAVRAARATRNVGRPADRGLPPNDPTGADIKLVSRLHGSIQTAPHIPTARCCLE